MKWTENTIAFRLIQHHFRGQMLSATQRCSHTGDEADLLLIDKKLRFIDVEIKTSRQDFKNDRKKHKWKGRKKEFYTEDDLGKTKRIVEWEIKDWPNKIYKHYFALPETVWSDDLLEFLPSDKCGIILLSEGGNIYVHKKAKTNSKAPKATIDDINNIARLTSLRYWNMYSKYLEIKELYNEYKENIELGVNN